MNRLPRLRGREVEIETRECPPVFTGAKYRSDSLRKLEKPDSIIGMGAFYHRADELELLLRDTHDLRLWYPLL